MITATVVYCAVMGALYSLCFFGKLLQWRCPSGRVTGQADESLPSLVHVQIDKLNVCCRMGVPLSS